METESIMEIAEAISLHGLGFIQVKLPNKGRLHVWHPELPRRRCFEHSAIHNHRFSFISKVLKGTQVNENVTLNKDPSGAIVGYSHEGPRQVINGKAIGGRPWTPSFRANILRTGVSSIPSGSGYRMAAYDYHRTISAGIVITYMRKMYEGNEPAHSTCTFGIEPEADFDRFQLTEAQLWDVVVDAFKS